MKLSAFSQDVNLAHNGTEIRRGDLTVIIGRSNNPRAKEVRDKLYENYGDVSKLSNDELHDINLQVYAKGVIFGWSGLEDDQGNPIPFSPEVAYKIMADPMYVDFYEWIANEAHKIDNFRAKVIESTSGELQTS